jgi:hypothetical protein
LTPLTKKTKKAIAKTIRFLCLSCVLYFCILHSSLFISYHVFVSVSLRRRICTLFRSFWLSEGEMGGGRRMFRYPLGINPTPDNPTLRHGTSIPSTRHLGTSAPRTSTLSIQHPRLFDTAPRTSTRHLEPISQIDGVPLRTCGRQWDVVLAANKRGKSASITSWFTESHKCQLLGN